jgi:transposase
MRKASTVKIFKDCLGIGIDVSKVELVVVGLTTGEPYIKRVTNQLTSIKAFVRALNKAGYGNKIICESTGHYHLKLALACHELGMEIIVLNPLQSSKHSKAKVRKTKTDAEDGLMLATMCLTEPNLPKPMRLTTSKALIQLKMGQLASIEKQLQKSQSSLNQYEETYAELGLELSELQISLRAHHRSLKRLQGQLVRELEGLLVEGMADRGSYTRLCSLPGYSNVVSGLVGQLDRQVKGANSWVAYAGLDISVRESGTWKGRGKLTKRGNAYLRKRLFQAAWGACMNYDYVRAYYDTLKAQGRNHTEAICMISRKLLKIAYHVVVNEKEYDAKIAFAS